MFPRRLRQAHGSMRRWPCRYALVSQAPLDSRQADTRALYDAPNVIADDMARRLVVQWTEQV